MLSVAAPTSVRLGLAASPSLTLLSMGMGVDSAAIATRWLLEPRVRPCPPEDLILLTAMTGAEFDATRAAMETHLLPLLRREAVRVVQVARAGQADADGYVVLDDSRAPRRMVMRGPWALDEEMTAAATVPQLAGPRICSIRAKGNPLDRWAADHIGSRCYTHVIGFAAEEQARILRDRSFGAVGREPRYVLDEWGWDRDACRAYLREVYGVDWPRSCCYFCPFQTSGGASELLERWRAEPELAARALLMERRALAANPKAGMLFGREAAIDLVARRREAGILAAYQRACRHSAWSLYEVRRIYLARVGQPGRKGPAWRSLRVLATGDEEAMVAALAERGPMWSGERRPPRVFGRVAEPPYPAVEQSWAVGPAGAATKERPGFAERWARLTGQDALF